MLLNCGVGEDSWESLGLQGEPTSPSKGNQSWIFTGRTDVEGETLILWSPDVKNWLIGKDPDAGKDWMQEEKGMAEWNGWMASPTLWTWVWASSQSWWWTGKPGVLQSTGSRRTGHDWATELKIWMKPKWLSVEELIKKMWYIYTMEYYSGIHRKEWNDAICCNMDGLKNILLSEVSQMEKGKYYMSFICIIYKKIYKWTYLKNIKTHTLLKQMYSYQRANLGEE